MKGWRRDIHAHPETAFEELRTADFVAEKLAEFGIEVHRGLATTGVVGVLDGQSNRSGRSIGLRADMDALHIQELNGFDHRSRHEGKMHACGHDGHTAMLLGAAKYLAETRNFRSEEHTSELQSLMRNSYAVFCLKKKKNILHKQVSNIR